MNEIILVSLGLIVVVVGIYVFLAERARRRGISQTQQPWDPQRQKSRSENKKPPR
jgi:uncharacterized protein YjeT (DUF2065 family)